MSADDRVLELVSEWWGQALEDLTVAQRTADLAFACCFHCQQAVEKSAKALLVLHQIDFPKSHDIGELLALLGNSPTAVPEEPTAGLEALTRFAVETRYPPGRATQEEAEDALGRTAQFLTWVRQQLPERFPDPAS